MSVLFLAVPVALLLVAAALWAFIWAARDGQLDDLETPALRILQSGDCVEPESSRDEQRHERQ